MNRKEVINQLKELIEDRKSFMVGDYDEVYDKDVQALEYAIKELTAQGVPVQEQNKFVPENSNGICKDTNKCINPQNDYLHEIEELCKPIYAYLKNNYDPHCSLSISDNQIKLIRTEVGIPVNKITAQEVPVQEQLKTLEFINKELNINLSQKQYEEIAMFDFCTPKYTAYEILKLLKILTII